MYSRLKDLSFKLPLFVLLVSLLPLTVFGYFSIRLGMEVRIESQARANRITATQSVVFIKSELESLQRSLQLSSENLQLVDLDRADREWALISMMRQLPELQSLTFLDAKGDEQAKIDQVRTFLPSDLVNRSNDPVYRQVLGGKVYLSPARNLDIGKHAAFLSIPLIDPASQELAAVLVADFLINRLADHATSFKVGKEGSIYLVESSGRVIVHGDASLTQRNDQLPLDNLVDASLQYPNLNKIEVLGTARAIAGTDWLIVVERPMAEIRAAAEEQKKYMYAALLATVVLVAIPLFSFLQIRVNRPLQLLEQGTEQLGRGEFNAPIPIRSGDELGRVTSAFDNMAGHLIRLKEDETRVAWLKDGLAELNDEIRDWSSLEDLANKGVSFVATYIEAQVGALYIRNQEGLFILTGRHAYAVSLESAPSFTLGQGLVGQAARDKSLLEVTDLPDDYCLISSGLGSCMPDRVLLLPLIYDDEVVGVMELGRLKSFTADEKEFLTSASETIAIMVNTTNRSHELSRALEKSQQMGEELQTQQEELRASNEELEEQTQQLQASEEQLKSQEEELRAANEELHEKAEMLKEQQDQLSVRNNDLQIAQQLVEERSRNLELASRYKSEFLANMSHELRTPLNSLLILSRDLMLNREENLNADQVESAQVIHQSGNDLLNLINEILDLAKIESGKMSVAVDAIDFSSIKGRLESDFRHVAEDRGIQFNVDIDQNLPEGLKTDAQRLFQILKNLLSNAIKFTSEGSVQVRIFRPDNRQDLSGCFTSLDPQAICGFAVTDTGVGIPEASLAEIFEAFRQVDGTISRRFGGTGLGLSISRQIATLLGGDLQVVSEEGKGSTFTLLLPLQYREAASAEISSQPPAQPETVVKPVAASPAPADPAKGIADNRDELTDSDRFILIIEDDLAFARIIAKMCQAKGFKFLHAADGDEGLRLAGEYRPDAIFLDIRLPGLDGLDLLGRLKANQELRHIPVHVMSVDDSADTALKLGAIGFLNKPVEKEYLDQAFERIEKFTSGKVRKLLIVEDNVNQQKSIRKLIGNGDVETFVAGSGQAALEILQNGSIDCMILDLTLSDMTGFELLQQVEEQTDLEVPPTIIYTGKDLTLEEVEKLRIYTSSIIVKGVQSPERLLDEASLFLHRVVADLPAKKQKIISKLYNSDEIFAGRKILVVDDDMRNVFALSKTLASRGMEVFKAADGQKAIALLESEPSIELVLMDIMMPVMDGYEAMRRIRQQPRFSGLPILALTAKAMSDDRARCIEAGANDYLTKPVDVDHLLSLLRIWLQR